MSIYMSRAELEEISEGLITAYANKFSNRVIQSIDIEHFITEFLMLRIEYASFAEDDAGRIGFLADGATPLLIHQDGKMFLMPRRIIENALAKYNQSNPIKVYGDNTITSKDKAVIRRMAAYIGVSYTALVIRLRDMGLFEYHNILEYISNELNLGGVSQ